MAKLLTNKKQFNNLTIKQSNNGFTLIELLTVITIIGILAAIVSVSFSRVQMKSRDSKRKIDLKAIQQALELYFEDNGKYPDMTFIMGQQSAWIKCENDFKIDWGQKFECDGISYMNPLPTDPLELSSDSEINYVYMNYSSPSERYELSARLENSNDPENCTGICAGILPCMPQPNRNYCVESP